jgi:nitronate monooxygenase
VLGLRRLETPIVQAGMGTVSRHELAAAVSDAGGLGTIAVPRGPLAAELAAARALTNHPVAVNLLLPFLTRQDIDAAAGADVVITFWGEPRRLASGTWIHQCGSVAEAKAAAEAGADAVIAQGVEAGGHVRGKIPVLELLERTLAAVRIPVLAAGGIVERDEVRTVLEAGAVAAVLGTRFLMSDESRAHPEYKRRCARADATLLTELFGLGWPDAPHRVVANAATERWLQRGARGPGWIRTVNRLTRSAAARVPGALRARALSAQRSSWPLLSPQPPTDDLPPSLVDAGPLYAGESVRRIDDIAPAGELVARLTP